MNDLQGKTVLLTGASGGIGSPTAAALGRAGASVIAHYNSNLDGAQSATRELADDQKLLLHADFSEAGAGRRLWAEALEWHGRVDVLVNNAAIMSSTSMDTDDLDWDETWPRIFRVNVFEPASLIRAAVHHFRDSGGGIIISLSSWAGQQGSAIPQLSAYASTKAAIKAITQTVARSDGGNNILTYVLAPGIVKTNMSALSASTRGGDDALKAILPLGEMVPPSEVADLITFLASGTCRHLTGATIDINGAAYVR